MISVGAVNVHNNCQHNWAYNNWFAEQLPNCQCTNMCEHEFNKPVFMFDLASVNVTLENIAKITTK